MFGSRKAKREIKNVLANRPKYKIADEAFETQASARSQAYGRDRSIQMQQQNVEQDAANAASMARDVSGSTTSLLSTIAAINAGKNDTNRALASDEAGMQQGKLQNMYAANNAMIDEKDKEWNYNVNMPYQQKLQRANEKLRRSQLMRDAFTGVSLAVGGSAATAGTTETGGSGNGEGGAAGAIFGMFTKASDRNVKKDIRSAQYGLSEILKMYVVEYSYLDNDKNHIGLIAQDLQLIIPEAVFDTGSHLAIDYTELIPVVIKAIQEQGKELDSLRNELEQLKKEA